jgi:hypothetical protein
VALLAGREWRALLACLAAAGGLALASLALFGAGPWRWWLGLISGADPAYAKWLLVGRLNGQSAYTNALFLGAPPWLAQVAQGAATALAALLVWRAFRVPAAPPDLRLSVLLAATILAAPHTSNYDAVMLAVAVLLFLCHGLDHGFRPGDLILTLVAWNIELLDPPQMVRPGVATPFVILLFISVLVARLGRPRAEGPTRSRNS